MKGNMALMWINNVQKNKVNAWKSDDTKRLCLNTLLQKCLFCTYKKWLDVVEILKIAVRFGTWANRNKYRERVFDSSSEMLKRSIAAVLQQLCIKSRLSVAQK